MTAMTRYFPFDAGTGSDVRESQWREMARLWLASGVVAGYGSQLAVSAAGLNVSVATGAAWCNGHYAASDSVLGFAITGHATLPRIDRVVVQCDTNANTIGVVVKPGTAAASPVAPVLSTTDALWEVPLAQISVPAAAVAVTVSLDERAFVGPAVDGPPIGSLQAFAGATAPVGWLLCQGQAVSRTAYAALFAVLGTTYGAGDGTTTFNLPNLQDRMIVGVSGTRARGATGGSTTITAAAMPSHTHDLAHGHTASETAAGAHTHTGTTSTAGAHTHNVPQVTVNGGSAVTVQYQATALPATPAIVSTSAGDHSHSIATDTSAAHSHAITVANAAGNTGAAGSSAADGNMPPFLALNWIIRF